MNYDVIVIGLGGMGSSAAANLARRGLRVLGLEQYRRGHSFGSSHGHTRIIRTAYYEHPDYVPLCRKSFAAWHQLEQVLGRHLLTQCPCLSLGAKNTELFHGVVQAADEHHLEVQQLGPGALRVQYPQFQFGDDIFGILEKDSGFLYVDECVRALQDQAIAHGADLRFGEAVVEWKTIGDTVAVRTPWETLSAARLIITAGPWARQVLAELSLPLTIMRQVPMWFQPSDPTPFRRDNFPIFIADLPNGAFYGLPMIESRGIKVAMHYGGDELSHPDQVQREITSEDERPVRDFLKTHLPLANGPRMDASVCLYTLTPDRHFIIDRHSQYSQIAIAAGFSGHGFKFAPVVGEMLADLVTSNSASGQIELFTMQRFIPNIAAI